MSLDLFRNRQHCLFIAIIAAVLLAPPASAQNGYTYYRPITIDHFVEAPIGGSASLAMKAIRIWLCSILRGRRMAK